MERRPSAPEAIAGSDPAEAAAIVERGRWLFAQDCRFVTAAARLDQLPPEAGPEIAFAGRSNVGKSSLVNALTGRHTLARTSGTPGRTQQLIFFDLGGRLTLVDLPGYGYAQVARTQVAAWTRLLKAYLQGRVTLRRACLLVDARHGLKASDREIMGLLDHAAVPYLVVLTKADKVPAAELERGRTEVAAGLRRHRAAFPHPFPTSAEKGTGIPELRAELARLAEPDPA